MVKAEVLQRIQKLGIVPVLRTNSAESAIAIASALAEGGIPVLELTMTVPGAIEVIRRIISHSRNQILVGAGTVLDPETARLCILAGAQFIVSPALNIKTIEMCRRYAIAAIPGALTPTEIITAWESGADVVKVFPCAAVGGAKYIRALRAPLPQIELIPTGGVSLENAAEFIAAGAFALGVGADLIDNSAIEKGNPELITENARKYVSVIEKAREQIGIARKCGP